VRGILVQGDGDQGALIQPGCFRGSLQTSSSRCAHSALVKPWIDERGLEPDADPQGESLNRGIARARKLFNASVTNSPTGDGLKGLRSPVLEGKATGGHCPTPEVDRGNVQTKGRRRAMAP